MIGNCIDIGAGCSLQANLANIVHGGSFGPERIRGCYLGTVDPDVIGLGCQIGHDLDVVGGIGGIGNRGGGSIGTAIANLELVAGVHEDQHTQAGVARDSG